MKTMLLTITLFLMLSFAPHLYANVDLRAFYEQKKMELIPTFVAPELGSEVILKMASGQSRPGILMRLNSSELSLMTDAGDTVSYQRSMLHESSRAQFFAEDFAHVKALELTRQKSKEIQRGILAEEEANTHDGRISVTSKIEKKTTTEKEEKEGKNKEGGKTTTRITTKTQTQNQVLTISIANLTSHPDSLSLHWYFISKNVEDDKVEVHESGTKKVIVGARKRVGETVKSKNFEVVKTSTERTNSYSDPRIKETGEMPTGYLVILKYNDEMLDAKASSKTFLSEEWMRKIRYL